MFGVRSRKKKSYARVSATPPVLLGNACPCIHGVPRVASDTEGSLLSHLSKRGNARSGHDNEQLDRFAENGRTCPFIACWLCWLKDYKKIIKEQDAEGIFLELFGTFFLKKKVRISQEPLAGKGTLSAGWSFCFPRGHDRGRTVILMMFIVHTFLVSNMTKAIIRKPSNTCKSLSKMIAVTMRDPSFAAKSTPPLQQGRASYVPYRPFAVDAHSLQQYFTFISGFFEVLSNIEPC